MEESCWLPDGYTLDESDSDLLVVRRTDGSFVAAFSARGATRESILEAAEEDCKKYEQQNPEHHRRGRRWVRPWHTQGRP